MTLGYFRKSTFDLDKTISNASKAAEADGWKILGTADLPEAAGKMILICRTDWVKTIMKADYSLIGFLPCAVSIFKKDGGVLVGSGQPSIMRAVAQDPTVTRVAGEAEVKLKALIHAAAGVSELKPTAVKLYSTMSCPYCKMEKSWLDEQKVEHEVVYVDRDQAAAEEIVRRTGQMGVPVTEVQFADSEPEFVIGFDRPRLTNLLGLKA